VIGACVVVKVAFRYDVPFVVLGAPGLWAVGLNIVRALRSKAAHGIAALALVVPFAHGCVGTTAVKFSSPRAAEGFTQPFCPQSVWVFEAPPELITVHRGSTAIRINVANRD
jgi:hypothetical protein